MQINSFCWYGAAWLVQSWSVGLDLGVVSLSPMLGIEVTEKNSFCGYSLLFSFISTGFPPPPRLRGPEALISQLVHREVAGPAQGHLGRGAPHRALGPWPQLPPSAPASSSAGAATALAQTPPCASRNPDAPGSPGLATRARGPGHWRRGHACA